MTATSADSRRRRGTKIGRRALLVAFVAAYSFGIMPAYAAEPFVVVVDAGHGGRDGGALGRKGTREKDVTLRFAKLLAAELATSDGIEIAMTREGDVAVRLDDRVAFGQQRAADLFVSIHADSIRNAGVRGASIYTLADEASDKLAASLAESQAKSDLLAGFEAPAEEKPAVAGILLDLMRRETEAFSHDFAERAVRTLAPRTRMIRNPHRFANFRVLRAPDVPSVLIELGYLSNRADEQLLRNDKWLRETAGHLASAIVAHARNLGRLDPA